MTKPDPYQCATCGRYWPVRILARDCEAKHAKEATDRAASP